MAEPVGSNDPGRGPRDSGAKPEVEPQIVSVARYSGLGLQLAASVVLFLAAGQWLDRRIGTDPYLTVLGAFVGGAAGFYALYVGLVKGQQKKEPKS
jgi:ATP synthase protein I